MKLTLILILILGFLPLFEEPIITSARDARDRGDVGAMRKLITQAEANAKQTGKFDDYVRLALLQDWMCETLESSNNEKLVKDAAQAGVMAAEKAVTLNAKSSQAHQLLADLLGQLAPNVMGGGMKYGQRAVDEAEKAIALDPANPQAYITRGISYLYTPEAFGGNKQKAGEFFSKAVQLDPKSDTGHIWLALFHLDADKLDDARREANEALKLNPNRAFSKFVLDQTAKVKK